MIAEIVGTTYRYAGAEQTALDDVCLSFAEGEAVLLAGPSAGGKSTLLRLLNGLVPQFHGGQLRGQVRVAGLDPARTPTRRMATLAGLVLQEPEAQGIAETVEDDIAFGMEQQGIARAEMQRRIAALAEALRIGHLQQRRLATLSGGERQRAAIAAVLALEPRMLLLDEPTSQIDPEGAEAVIAAILKLHRERGLATVIAEHRLERLLPVVDAVVEVEAGRARRMSPREAVGMLRFVPPVCALGRLLGLHPLPLTVDEARCALAGRAHGRRDYPWPRPAPGDELVRASGLTVEYRETVALRDVEMVLREGEVVALVGANGSGKTTLFRALTGLVRPQGGTITVRGGRVADSVAARTAVTGLVPQDPALALYRETVGEEVAETLRARRRGTTIDQALAAWNLGPLATRNPRDLSVGQQQRVAVAAMLAHEPPVWLLDEPTRGADGEAKAWLAARLRAHAAAGGAAIVATHDIESAARYATRVIGLEDGRVAFDLPAQEALGAVGPLPTQVARVVPGALVPEEVVA